MKHTPSTDPALREALSRLAQRQLAPPAGMADRFMARLAEQQAETIKPVPSDAAESPAPPTPRRFTLRRVTWLPAAAAAAIAAILWWPGDAPVNTPVIMEETEVADVVSTAPSPTLPQPRRVEQELGTRAAAPAGALNESPSTVVRARPPALPAPSTSDADGPATPARQVPVEAPAPLIAEPPAPAQPAAVASPAQPAQLAAASQPPATAAAVTASPAFTAADRALDRRAAQADTHYASLIVGEEAAATLITLRQRQPARPTFSQTRQTQNNSNAKPIRI